MAYDLQISTLLNRGRDRSRIHTNTSKSIRITLGSRPSYISSYEINFLPNVQQNTIASPKPEERKLSGLQGYIVSPYG